MKVIIRLSTESSYTVTVPDNCSVEQLKALARVGSPDSAKLPTQFKLIHNGEKLAPDHKPLSEFITGSDVPVTVILMSNGSDTPVLTPSSSAVESSGLGAAGSSSSSSTTVPPKKRKVRCSFKTCKAVPLRNVGSCSYCSGKFCAKHRLLEDHICQGLQYCKENAHEKNAMKLQSESTITSRV